jgi:hypothetical protein
MKDKRGELLERANLSRTRLAASELGASGRAWKLWAACIAETVDFSRAGAQTYASTLATAARIDRTHAGRLMREFDELGILGWDAAPRGSKDISDLSLPSLMPRDAARGSVDTPCDAAYSSIEVESIELRAQHSQSGAGAHHSPLSTAPLSGERSEDWHAERRAIPGTWPAPDYDWDAYDAAVDAAWRAANGSEEGTA